MRPERFFKQALIHMKGEFAKKPFILEPWQKQITRHVFGWVRKSDGMRVIRKVYIEIPRKNGKSTFAAGLGLLLLFGDKEHSAEIYGAAGDREQAGIIFDIAAWMVKQNDELDDLCEVFKNAIVFYRTASSYKAISSESKTKHGYNSHATIFDELHVQPNRDLYDVLTSAAGSRRQPLHIFLTTAGYDKKSICYEVHEYAMKVRRGIIKDETFLPIIYAANDKSDWTSPKVWRKANPNIGVSVTEEYIAQECKEAQEVPGRENTFKRLHLNMWTEQASRWFAIARWDEGASPKFVEKELHGKRCMAGLDLASTIDIAALVLFFYDTQQVICRFYVPAENVADRVRKDQVPYDIWIKQGYINTTPGNVIDYDYIRKDITEQAKIFNIVEIGIDPWNSQQLQTQLDGDGFTVVPFRQGFASMTGPSKELERIVTGRTIKHNGNPVLRWMASNVAIKFDPAANLKPDKEASNEKIDGIVALIMAIGRAMESPDADFAYENRGIRTV